MEFGARGLGILNKNSRGVEKRPHLPEHVALRLAVGGDGLESANGKSESEEKRRFCSCIRVEKADFK